MQIFYIAKQLHALWSKVLAKDCHFAPGNVWKYLAFYVNKSLE